MNVTLKNTGTAPLNFSSSPFVSGATDFTIVVGSTTCVVGTPVAASSSCVVAIAYTPSALGAENATLNFADNATPSTQSVSLTGTGTGASVPSSVSFGTMVPVNAPLPLQGPMPTFPSMPVMVMNTNSAAGGPLNFSSISITGTNGSDFGIVSGSTTCIVGTPVAPGGTCVVQVTFMPSTTSLTTASESASLVLKDSSGTGAVTTQSVALSGTGVPWVGVSWSDPNASAATDSYNVYRMQVSSGTPSCSATLTGYTQVNSAPILNSAGTQFIDGLAAATAVGQGNSYCYIVTIINSGGGVSSPTALGAPTIIPAMP
jgi:hypothetical protein